MEESNATVEGQVGASMPTGQFAAGAMVDGKYRVDRVLGEGGMGMVYLAKSIHTEIEVVIKAVRPEIAHRADIRERTLAEGKALARIDHPNVVQLKSVVVTGKELLLVMQYIEGENLEDRIMRHAKTQKPMALDEALDIFRQILKGVSAAHAEGVIHRDIKPANVLIRAKDRMVKVTDFGIAKPEADAQSGKGQTQGIIGTVNYMSPEQVTGRKDLDRRVDIYALGIVLFEMLTGMLPYDADNTYEILKMHVDDPLPSATVGRGHLPAQLDGVLQKACAKDRDHRYASCEEFLAALEGMEAALSGMSPTAMSGPHVPQTIPDAPSMTPSAMQPPPAGGAFSNVPVAANFVNAVAQGPPPPTQGSTQPSLGPPITQQTPYGPPPGYPQPMTRPGTITGQSTELPVAQDGGKGWVMPVVIASIIASVATVVIVVGVGPFADDESEDPISEVTPKKKKKKKSSPAASANTKPDPNKSPLEALAGRWTSERGAAFIAVLVGDRLEFRIEDVTPFAPQGYRANEPRFILKALEGEQTTFQVEDRVRPLTPVGSTYDSDNARSTCIGIWTEAGGSRLRATVAGDQLDVESAKIEPSTKNFIKRGKKVLSCKGLEKLTASKTPVTLKKDKYE